MISSRGRARIGTLIMRVVERWPRGRRGGATPPIYRRGARRGGGRSAVLGEEAHFSSGVAALPPSIVKSTVLFQNFDSLVEMESDLISLRRREVPESVDIFRH
jgi:hypothetical protein